MAELRVMDRAPKGVIEGLADGIRADIQRGHYKTGERIPTYRELALEYNVSIPSVQCAVKQLKTEGLLSAIQGSGTYVSSPAPRTEITAAVRIAFNDIPSKRIVNKIRWALLRTFQKQHPEILLQFEPKPQGFLSEQEQLAVPDLFGNYAFSATILTHDFIKDLAFHRLLADVSPQVGRWERAGSIADAAWSVCRWENGIYGIPTMNDMTFLMLYLPPLRKLLGTDRNIVRYFSSWDLLRNIRDGTRHQRRTAHILCNGPERLFYLWLHILAQKEADPFSKEPPVGPPLIGTEGVTVLRYIQGLLQSGAIELVEESDESKLIRLFTDGTHPAMFVYNQGNMLGPLMKEGIPESDIAFLPLPQVKDGRQLQFLMSGAWVFSPYLSKTDLDASVKMAEYLSQPDVYGESHRRLADMFPERQYWMPIGENLSDWDRLTPRLWGSWKEYVRTWFPRAIARPSAPFWTQDIFEDDLRNMARNPALDISDVMAAHHQEAS